MFVYIFFVNCTIMIDLYFSMKKKNLKGPDQMSANSTFHCALAVQKKDFCTFCLIAKAAYLTLGKEVDWDTVKKSCCTFPPIDQRRPAIWHTMGWHPFWKPINWFQPVWQSRQYALKVDFPNTYIYPNDGGAGDPLAIAAASFLRFLWPKKKS